MLVTALAALTSMDVPVEVLAVVLVALAAAYAPLSLLVANIGLTACLIAD